MIEYIPLESLSIALSSGKLPIELINSVLPILFELLKQSKLSISFVTPWLFCLFTKMVKNGFDITNLLNIIYHCLPTQIPVYSYNDTIESFIFLLHYENPILKTPEFISKLAVESIHYRIHKVDECPYPNELEQYFLPLLSDSFIKPAIEELLQNNHKLLNQFIDFMKKTQENSNH